ncbi:MAG TPA: TlpA disulfide reductase family protein, partial [Pyrinomonadaceae bacterium]
MFLTNRKPLLALFLLVLLGVSLATSFAQPQNGARVDFSLNSLDNQTITSDSLRGEVVVLAFGASWLPLSKAQLQGVRKLADEYSDRGLVVYWVSTESEDPKSKNFASNDQLRAFAQKYGLKVTVLRDPDGVTSKKFGIDQLP